MTPLRERGTPAPLSATSVAATVRFRRSSSRRNAKRPELSPGPLGPADWGATFCGPGGAV